MTLLAGLALASFAGAATALILNLAPNPFIALEIAFWLLGSLEDRSIDHLMIATPFMLASWVDARGQARAFRALTLGEDAAASLGVDVSRTRMHGRDRRRARRRRGRGGRRRGRLRRSGGATSRPPRRQLRSGARGAALPRSPAPRWCSPPILRCGSVQSAVEIKLGVVTALIGVPIFLAMIFRERRLLEGSAS